MVVNGLAVGVLAAVAGTVVGLVGWLAARSAIERAAGRRIGRFDLPWDLVAVAALLAVVITGVAAWWPARQLSRLSIVGALSGRPAAPRPVHRSMGVAAVLVALGLALVGIAGPTNDPEPLPLILGLVAVVAGVVFLAPAAVRLLGPLATRLPFAPRLALRDLSRHQSRAAASLAAITLGIGICVAIVAVAATNVQAASEGNLAASHLLIEVADLGTAFEDGGALTDAERRELDERAATVVAAAAARHSSPSSWRSTPRRERAGSTRSASVRSKPSTPCSSWAGPTSRRPKHSSSSASIRHRSTRRAICSSPRTPVASASSP